ncbi:MAG: MBL fold metallo-hydrolase [Sandaracinaceae bacterium]|nr:MBL fold metallo-hydrolase [Sandaracinaceae bacterium]
MSAAAPALIARRNSACTGERDATLLLSHVHRDHIQGLPFFLPAWIPGERLEIAGAASALRRALETQMEPPCFPVRLSDMKVEIVREIESGSSFGVGGARVLAQALEHPGGVVGYRIEHAGRAIVYATDTEHCPEPGACPDPRLVSLAKGADVLISPRRDEHGRARFRGTPRADEPALAPRGPRREPAPRRQSVGGNAARQAAT